MIKVGEILLFQNIYQLIVAILGLQFGVLLWWLIRRWWIRRQPTEVDVFDVIEDPRKLLLQVYNPINDGLLADQNIPYQYRDSSRDIQDELRNLLKQDNKYLLIKAPTGLGKTREAAVLAQGLMADGYCVLSIKPGWLDIPKKLPAEITARYRKIVVFLDDLDKLFLFG